MLISCLRIPAAFVGLALLSTMVSVPAFAKEQTKLQVVKPLTIIQGSIAINSSRVCIGVDGGPCYPPNTQTTRLIVIQGKVISIEGRTATVRTPDIRPVCKPGQPCPQYIIAGVTFTVDTTFALFESADGTLVSDSLTVGKSVVVVGRVDRTASPLQNRVLQAQIVEQDAD
ncbi:hypothetical protein [uncultured Nostoc sp.]|uniref:hypothetical protein n=1 Tax=uncultured Nostoc sp. TaxID=340711 RepID=UPI0035CC000F